MPSVDCYSLEASQVCFHSFIHYSLTSLLTLSEQKESKFIPFSHLLLLTTFRKTNNKNNKKRPPSTSRLRFQLPTSTSGFHLLRLLFSTFANQLLHRQHSHTSSGSHTKVSRSIPGRVTQSSTDPRLQPIAGSTLLPTAAHDNDHSE
jgi:hypothetical protein